MLKNEKELAQVIAAFAVIERWGDRCFRYHSRAARGNFEGNLRRTRAVLLDAVSRVNMIAVRAEEQRKAKDAKAHKAWLARGKKR